MSVLHFPHRCSPSGHHINHGGFINFQPTLAVTRLHFFCSPSFLKFPRLSFTSFGLALPLIPRRGPRFRLTSPSFLIFSPKFLLTFWLSSAFKHIFLKLCPIFLASWLKLHSPLLSATEDQFSQHFKNNSLQKAFGDFSCSYCILTKYM